MISSSIDDRWHVTVDGKKARSARYGKGKRWRARYRLRPGGPQVTKAFERKVDAEAWLQAQTTAVHTGTYVDPAKERMTVGQWCDVWLAGYRSRKASTYRQAETHVKIIRATFGDVPIRSVKPSDVNAWVATMQDDGRAASYVYATYRRLCQLMSDAVAEGILVRSPCSRKTAPPQGQQRPYVATTAQVWALHDAFPTHLRPAVLLAAFAGLRLAECSGLRVSDVDFMRGIISPAVQYPAEQLKTEYSRTPIPVPHELSLMLAQAVQTGAGEYIVTSEIGRQAAPWTIERAMRDARGRVEGLPEKFRFHDLRHYFASLLISEGLDVKVVQRRMRHKNAATTLDVYGHMFPEKDETARSAVATAWADRAVDAEDSLRTN